MTEQPLDYLDFEHSEDGHGMVSLDALASVWPAQLAPLRAELQRLLIWAHAQGRCAPLDEGGDWDYTLQWLDADGQGAQIGFDAERGQLWLQPEPNPANGERCTLALTLCLTPAMAQALGQAFALDAD